MGKIDDIFINLDHHGFEEAVVKKITMVDLLNDEMSSLLDARLKDEIKKLQKENTILKKALKEMYKDLSNRCQALPPYEWYIEQAKESIK